MTPLVADSRSLLLDGKPWLPIMGEMHYARCPEGEWREALLKMRAGGIDIVATYVFWIHHEEIEGRFDWSGRRSLRGFARLCRETGLFLMVRCGPWCHGEVRNGGLPDWLPGKGFALRSDDPGYLAAARRLYAEIAGELRGLLWKDGGPVVGIQCENEYGGPAEHLLTLKQMARETGLDVPLYTRTGWPELSTPMPPGEFLPLFGAYAEGFWDREITPMPGKYADAFLFTLQRADDAIGTDQLGERETGDGDDADLYPYFCCEIGGGMETSYHRRVRIAPRDIESVGLVKLGCGNNLQGYYMYHGGINPDGRRSTLQESQATGYPNDLPVKSYDFQAPLGEFGQIREHYHRLRRLHLFLRDWGAMLSNLPARLPEARPANSRDTATLRWAARTDGECGFVFVNNYQRLQPMPPKEGTQFRLELRDGPLLVPDAPFTVPSDSAFFWPFHLDLGGVTLIYATAQPVCAVEDSDARCVVFAETPGVPAEFVFDGDGISVESAAGEVTITDGRIRVRHVRPGTDAALRLRCANGASLYILLLDEPQSLACWKGTLAGRERIFLTRAGLTLDGDEIRLSAEEPTDLTVAVFPAPPSLAATAGTPDGLFHRFTPPRPPARVTEARVEPVWAAGPARRVLPGSAGVAEAPSDEDFAGAGVWRITLLEDTDAERLRIRYVGDAARLYLDSELLTDNFYNGNPFEIGLRRYAPDIYRKELLLKILPLRRDAPIYLPEDAWPDFGSAESALDLAGVEVIGDYETLLRPE